MHPTMGRSGSEPHRHDLIKTHSITVEIYLKVHEDTNHLTQVIFWWAPSLIAYKSHESIRL